MSISPDFVEQIRKELYKNLDLFLSNSENIALNFYSSELVDITGSPQNFIELVSTPKFGIKDNKDLSDVSFFIGVDAPIDHRLWDHYLKIFLFLYPLFDLCISIGNGRESSWVEMMKIYNRNFLDGDHSTETELFHLESQYGNGNYDREQKSKQILKIDNDFDLENIEDDRKWRQMDVVQREGQEKFRAELFQVYSGKCAITQCDVPDVLEAAHITRYSGIDSNHVQNGLLLRKDIHTLFDKMLLTIDANTMQVVIAPKLIGSCYEPLSNQKIFLPKKIEFYPSLNSLKRHNSEFMKKHQDYFKE
ncbi:HNH endonuclease [Picosynechococcus sp. NKBG15041c]|uniref:HNH endonuclease n=1 Tax=Picosynechococcus sp. NKBG15041c TaxID=1407650 RepID=UPI00041AB986|nr:HNH endonuclease [Picosynechococcus sp. NKBG15041c]